MQITENRFSERGFVTGTVALFCAAVALRWARLDLMMFRFDQAEVAFRCMDAWRGNFPFTGIINSMGFRNAPGYIWALLPGFVFTQDPRWVTAWHGLLASTMIFPLALLGRRYRKDALAWLPAVLAAFLPVSIFAGRNLWAQYLLPACSAWALLWLDTALNSATAERQRSRSVSLAFAMMAFACSIHFSAGPLMAVAVLFGVYCMKVRWATMPRLGLPASLILLSLLPSIVDYWDQRVNPRQKPDYAQKFDAMLPEPLPWWDRLDSSVRSLFANFSLEAVPGISAVLPGDGQPVIVLDILVEILIAAGGICLVLRFLRRARNKEKSEPGLGELLLAWLLIPAVAGGLLVSRVNAGYFIGSMPAVWLLPLFLPQMPGGAIIKRALVGLIAAGGAGASLWFLAVIDREDIIPGNYYIKYGSQVKTIELLNKSGVGSGKVRHLSGDWFERSYAYIHKYVKPGKGYRWGMLEDTSLRVVPGRLSLMEEAAPTWVGTVAVMTFDDSDAGNVWAMRYYDIPNR